MKYILNINEGASDNLGDQAISESLTSILFSNKLESDTYNFTQVKIVNNIDKKEEDVSSNKIAKKSFLRVFLSKFKLIQQLRWFQLNIKKIITVSRNHYNIAFIGGGQLILSNTIFPIAMFTWVLILKVFGTKIIIIGVGSGENFNFMDKLLYKISFMFCSDIFLRDHESIIKLKKTFGIKADFIPDIAFCYEQFDIKKKNKLEKKLMIGIIDYSIFVQYAKEVGNKLVDEDKYIKLWANDILLKGIDFNEIILASTTTEDTIFSKKLYQYLKQLKLDIKVTIVEEVLTLKEYLKILKEMDTVMSARMHTLILAQLHGCFIIPWKISKKIEVYEKEYLNCDINNIKIQVEEKLLNILDKYEIRKH